MNTGMMKLPASFWCLAQSVLAWSWAEDGSEMMFRWSLSSPKKVMITSFRRTMLCIWDEFHVQHSDCSGDISQGSCDESDSESSDSDVPEYVEVPIAVYSRGPAPPPPRSDSSVKWENERDFGRGDQVRQVRDPEQEVKPMLVRKNEIALPASNVLRSNDRLEALSNKVQKRESYIVTRRRFLRKSEQNYGNLDRSREFCSESSSSV